MQQLLNLWAGLLCATVGALVPEKFFWYLLDLKWANNKWVYASHNDRFQLKLPEELGKLVTLPFYKPQMCTKL